MKLVTVRYCQHCKNETNHLFSDIENRYFCPKCDMPPRNPSPLEALFYDPGRDESLPPTLAAATKQQRTRKSVSVQSTRKKPSRRANPLQYRASYSGLTVIFTNRKKQRKCAVSWPEWTEFARSVRRPHLGGSAAPARGE